MIIQADVGSSQMYKVILISSTRPLARQKCGSSNKKRTTQHSSALTSRGVISGDALCGRANEDNHSLLNKGLRMRLGIHCPARRNAVFSERRYHIYVGICRNGCGDANIEELNEKFCLYSAANWSTALRNIDSSSTPALGRNLFPFSLLLAVTLLSQCCRN
jgi:hypothetical protein